MQSERKVNEINIEKIQRQFQQDWQRKVNQENKDEGSEKDILPN